MNKNQRARIRFSVIQFSLAIVLISLPMGLSGCAGLATVNEKNVPTQQASLGSYRVEMSGGFGKPAIYNGTLDGPLTVQSALERSGAIKKFRNMDVTILRIVEETGRPLKMSVSFNPRKNTITPEQDYALLPGDRIVVEAASNSMLDKVVSSVSGN